MQDAGLAEGNRLFPAREAAEKLGSRRTIVRILLNGIATPVASGCSKWLFSKAAASEEARRYKPHFVWSVRPNMDLGERKSSSGTSDLRESVRYVEPLSDARTSHGKGRVSARRGRAGEKNDFFSILLEFLHDPFGIAGEFHIALSLDRFPLRGAGCLNGAFPIGDLCAAFGGEFLLCHAGNDFQ